MSADDLVQTLQTGLHVTLGAAASLVESLQDDQKRTENLGKLSQEWNLLSADLAAKGKITEQEARSFVDSLLSQQGQPSSTANSSGAPNNSGTSPTPTPEVQQELQELTAQLAAMRAELERLRNQDASS